MFSDFLNSLKCVLPEEEKDFKRIRDSRNGKGTRTAFMPSVTWYDGICDLFDKRGGEEGKDLIWFLPAGQNDFAWLNAVKRRFTDFYEEDKWEESHGARFPGTQVEEFKESILLRSDDLQDEKKRTVLGANVILLRLRMSSGRETLLFILLEEQNACWTNIIEKYGIGLTWLVDSGKGMGDDFVKTALYPLMKQTAHPELLPAYYFAGLNCSGEIPEGYQYRSSMLDGYDKHGEDQWKRFSAVYEKQAR